MILAVCFVMRCFADYVSLDLMYSNDNSADVSKALVADILVGIPERKRTVMLDFSSDSVAFDGCFQFGSRTFDVMGSESDIVQYEGDSLKRREYYRMPIAQNCESAGVRSLPQRFYENCLNPERCDGVLGLKRGATLWQIWTSYCLSLEKLHVGRSNPYVRRVPDDYTVRQKKAKIDHRKRIGDTNNYDDDDDETDTIECSGSRTQNVCEFEALLAGRAVVVDFHTDDSFIYVPQWFYNNYLASIVKVDIHSEKRDEERRRRQREKFHRKRDVVFASRPPDVQEMPNVEHVRRFTDEMRRSRLRAMAESSFFRNSLHSETHAHWTPLVFEPSGNSTATIVIDFDLINHSPRYSNSFGGVERSSSDRFFANFAPSDLTLMLKVHPTEPPHSNRVSIGNGFFRRYEIHNDLLANRALIVRRLIVEHLSTWESIFATLLYTAFIRSVCNSLELLAPLMLGLPVVCSGCSHHENIFAQHRRTPYNMFREAIVYALTLVVPLIALVRLIMFVNVKRHHAFYAWAWLTIGANSLVLLVNLVYSTSTFHGKRPASGSYCWRAFRIIESRSSSSEQLMTIGVLTFVFVLHKETLGSLVTSTVGVLMVANAVRHLYQCYRHGTSILFARRTKVAEENRKRIADQNRINLFPAGENVDGVSDEPSPMAQKLWVCYVIIVVIGINLIGTIVFVSNTILLPTLHSALFAAFALAVAAYFAVHVVNNFTRSVLTSRRQKRESEKIK